MKVVYKKVCKRKLHFNRSESFRGLDRVSQEQGTFASKQPGAGNSGVKVLVAGIINLKTAKSREH